jgi:hypothetical protein
LPVFLFSHFELTVPCLGSKFQWWLIDTPNPTLGLKAAYATQNSTPQPTKLLRISQLPTFPLSYFELTVVHFGRKFQQWLVDTPDTPLRLRAAHATQNSMPQPTKLLQISQLPTFLLSRFEPTVPHICNKFEQWLIGTPKPTLLRAAYATQISTLWPIKLFLIS